MRAGDGAVTDTVFDLRANGGSQVWNVKAGRPGRFILSCMLAGFALLPAIYGAAALGAGPGPGLPGHAVSIPIFIVGTGLTIFGVSVAMGSYGSATLEASSR